MPPNRLLKALLLSGSLLTPFVVPAEVLGQEEDVRGLIEAQRLDQARALLEERRSSDQRDALAADLAAGEIRFALHGDASEERRRASAEQALDTIEAVLAGAEGDLRRRLEGDRILALHAAGRSGEAGDAYLELVSRGDALRPYVHDAGGAALLEARRPERAAAAYRQALELTPENDDFAVGLFYALVESERHQEALELARGRARSADDEQRELLWRLITVRGLAFSDRLAAAREAVDELHREVPDNPRVETLRATVLRWQGLPRRALAAVRRALELDPEFLDARLGLASSWVALRRFDQARGVLETLQDELPEHARLARFDRDLALDTGWLLDIGARAGESDAIRSPLGSEDHRWSVRVDSPILASHWRVFAGHDDQWVEIRDREIDFQRGVAGLRFLRGPIQLSLGRSFGSSVAEGGDGDGWQAALDLRPTDRISLGLGHEESSGEVPLRARDAGTNASRSTLAVAFVPRPGQVLRGGAQSVDFTDGNDREVLFALWRHRWLQGPRLRLHGTVAVFRSENDLGGRPYYNPTEDLSTDYSLVVEHLTWRRYERSFRQELMVAVGSYDQEGFGADQVLLARYGHRWRWAPRTELRYALEWRSRPYDGAREERAGLTVGLGVVIP